ncbi:MAG: TetR family transcriptional regulator [Microbacteriaceae bacterium]
MANITPASEMLRDSELLRVSPVQARSNKRLTAILDAAATLIQQKGYEELTTAAVAHEAGASIGTVYRYFLDRVDLLKALATRNFERTTTRFFDELRSAKPKSPSEAIDIVFDLYVDLYRTETGFRSLRMGDVLDLRPLVAPTASRRAAETLAAFFGAQYSMTVDEKFIHHLELNFITVDALLARAFIASEKGDPAFIDAARHASKIVAEKLV